VERIRFVDFHLSPMYIAAEDVSGRMKFVCESYVLDPTSAKVFQLDQGPESEVAVV
jgi:hypothetical protein